MEFISNYLLPDAAVLDPRMTETLPPKTTASTGFDALCHAIEAYSCNQKNPLSDAYATAAIKLVVENIETVITDGKNRKARLAMANASTMARSRIFQFHGGHGARHRPCAGRRL